MQCLNSQKLLPGDSIATLVIFSFTPSLSLNIEAFEGQKQARLNLSWIQPLSYNEPFIAFRAVLSWDKKKVFRRG